MFPKSGPCFVIIGEIKGVPFFTLLFLLYLSKTFSLAILFPFLHIEFSFFTRCVHFVGKLSVSLCFLVIERIILHFVSMECKNW